MNNKLKFNIICSCYISTLAIGSYYNIQLYKKYPNKLPILY